MLTYMLWIECLLSNHCNIYTYPKLNAVIYSFAEVLGVDMYDIIKGCADLDSKEKGILEESIWRPSVVTEELGKLNLDNNIFIDLSSSLGSDVGFHSCLKLVRLANPDLQIRTKGIHLECQVVGGRI
ncbi:hypothetical protein RIF29_14924 [Crotalaria pallida]|uniref:Uncharacterized protein n=1 Tax=Crotalaria pallida TaxID=3830 RepID=A0AAN9FE43_CROPI